MSGTNKDTQSRKWLITINNPIEKDWTHEALQNAINELSSVIYWCMGDETGTEGTFHTHIYIVLKNQIRRGTLDKKFVGGHFDKPNGTSTDNRAYVFKEGEKFNKDNVTGAYDYIDSKGNQHSGVHLDSSNQEHGELPQERQGSRTDVTELYNMIKEGLSNYEIMENNPKYILHMDKVEKARQVVREEEYKDRWRNLEVTYIYGTAGAGKTRSIMDKFGYSNVYRVTNYQYPFDSYKGQDVIIFEEFRSSIRLSSMLNYLDGYPVELPARYMNRVACYTKVFIISNIDIRQQYVDEQYYERESWRAFIRRVHNIKVYFGDKICEYPLDTYLKEGWFFLKNTPFDKEEEND